MVKLVIRVGEDDEHGGDFDATEIPGGLVVDTAIEGDARRVAEELFEIVRDWGKPRYCPDCGVEEGSGDPHNPEAHIAEMRAAENAYYERQWEPPEDDMWAHEMMDEPEEEDA